MTRRWGEGGEREDWDGRIVRDHLGRGDTPLPVGRGQDLLEDMMGKDTVVDAGESGSFGDGVHHAEIR